MEHNAYFVTGLHPQTGLIGASEDSLRGSRFGREAVRRALTPYAQSPPDLPERCQGIQVIVPSGGEIAYIQDKIASELGHGVVKDDTRREFVAIIEGMKQREGIQQVVLGCTVLPLLHNDEPSPVPCLNTADIHIRGLVQAITRDK